METKPEYTVVKGTGLLELIEEVNKMIGMGWLPLGGVVTSEEVDHVHYYQAMTRNLTQKSE